MDKLWIKSMQVMAPTCHQLEKRSYHLGKWQLPVCARCQGVYTGYIIGLFISIPILAVLLPLTYIDGFIQLKTAYTSTNLTRLITGIISGIATLQLLKIIINLVI
ncbi:DUF2085 domain-containing protein [Mollicutes bacterium LVI A0039]|nr:DUF2085 domain-containing protein [Mollicutes bacterium LVI A0039]